MQSILLITGWAVGIQPLQPLQKALISEGFKVELVNIFNGLERTSLEQYGKIAQGFDVIIGWSLGGQLATLLAQHVYEHTAQAKTLITLASNPCFMMSSDWSFGMDHAAFQSFKAAFKQDPHMTLKRFCYLVTQGGTQAKQDWQHLQCFIQIEDQLSLLTGLELLERLNMVDILNQYAGHQFHIYSEGDGLVSHKIVDRMKKLSARFLKVELISGSHGFPVFKYDELSAKISQYIKSKNKNTEKM